MSDPLASTLAELRRRLEADAPAATDEAAERAASAAQPDLWQLSEMELDRLMGRHLEQLHRLLPAEPQPPPTEPDLADRLRLRLGTWIQELLLPFSAPQRARDALLTELGLAAYVRQRLQEARQNGLAERIAALEEEVALLRQRLDRGGSGD